MRPIFCILISLLVAAGCGKKEFLDAKPNSTLYIPTTLDDFQAMMDKDAVLNEMPEMGELASDNYYLTQSAWQAGTPKERNVYLWAPDPYEGLGNVLDWNTPYQQVFYANIVLEGIDKVTITPANRDQWNAVKGAAFFVRAHAFYQLAQLFAPVYDSTTADKDLGIPLRLSSDINAVSVRASVRATYDRILNDLSSAFALLPQTVPFNNRNRPSKPAAMGLKARTFLSMRAYVNAGACADSSLKLYSTLLDYNTLNAGSNLPFNKSNNIETMYQARIDYTTQVLKAVTVSGLIVDSVLYRSYDNNDLRKSVFFTAVPNPKGTYTTSIFCFSGLATDEVYLMRAECYARAGNITAAMNDVDTLLQYRWKTGTAPVMTAANKDDALNIVLTERRKELYLRNLRWMDIRRLNKEGFNITLKRVLNSQTYTLLPGDRRFIFPIPPD
ncbi:MAG: RagB/SusD family nutrient uptake outer membrane protein, partial [Bacteroidetes bacterium]|nr:RagB/SusD family nutrient uptake outer membrane protein [Bacteroidota bacterium]